MSLIADGYFTRLEPMPPKPHIHLDDVLPPLSDSDARAMRIGQAYSGGLLTMREREYSRGIGVCAPAQMVLPLKPGYERFVALVGIDDDVRRRSMAPVFQPVKPGAPQGRGASAEFWSGAGQENASLTM